MTVLVQTAGRVQVHGQASFTCCYLHQENYLDCLVLNTGNSHDFNKL